MSFRSYKATSPGWGMTDSQRHSFWRKWGDVCEAQGWDKLPPFQREAKRIEILGELGFASAKDVDKTAGCDRVFRKFEELAGVVHAKADDGGRARLLHRIGEAISELAELGCPPEVWEKILRDFGVVPGVIDISDLPENKLLTLSRTLSRYVGDWKKKIAKTV
jgi:hypothetical protein